jgi:hypothetical protein
VHRPRGARGPAMHHGVMPMTSAEFLTALISQVSEAEGTLREHLEDQEGELLLHLLTADLRRLAITWFEDGQSERLTRLLGVVDTALREGDDAVENAIAVSFVEDTGWWDPDMDRFIAVWPDGLRAEAQRQRDAT